MSLEVPVFLFFWQENLQLRGCLEAVNDSVGRGKQGTKDIQFDNQFLEDLYFTIIIIIIIIICRCCWFDSDKALFSTNWIDVVLQWTESSESNSCDIWRQRSKETTSSLRRLEGLIPFVVMVSVASFIYYEHKGVAA